MAFCKKDYTLQLNLHVYANINFMLLHKKQVWQGIFFFFVLEIRQIIIKLSVIIFSKTYIYFRTKLI